MSTNSRSTCLFATNLRKGHKIKSKSGEWLTVLSTNHTSNKVSVGLVNSSGKSIGEIDFKHYDEITEFVAPSS